MSVVSEMKLAQHSTTTTTDTPPPSSSPLPGSSFPLCDLPSLAPPLKQRNGRPDQTRPGYSSGTLQAKLQQRPAAEQELQTRPAGQQQRGRLLSEVPQSNGPHSLGQGPGFSSGPALVSSDQLDKTGLGGQDNLPNQSSSTAPNSGKYFGSSRLFFPPENDEDPSRLPTTSFSWESIDSQVGSRHSLLDRQGRSKLLTRPSIASNTQPLSCAIPTSQGDAGAGDAMDLTRRQREQRKKDIRSKLRLDGWKPEHSHSERRCCNWTFVFDPSGRLVYYWSAVVSLAFLYNFWVIIYRTAFDEIQGSTVFIWFPLDYMADFIYVMDILIHFRTAYLEDGVLQTDNMKLRQHYMNSTTFYVDLLCLLPLDFLYLSLHFQSMLRICRLVKIYRFWEFLDRTERHTNYPNMFRLVTLLHYLLVAFHWNSCIFFKLHKGTGFGHEQSEPFGTIPDLNREKTEMREMMRTVPSDSSDQATARDIEEDDILKLYLMSYYWTVLAMTTIGGLPHPTTHMQYLYVIIQLIIGLITFAIVLGYVASIVANISAARKDFQAKLDGVKTYMRIRKVPSNIQNKVIKWFDYLWLTQKSSEEEKSINCLPDKLKGEIAIHVHLDTLKRVEIFQNTEAGFLCELVLRLRPILFSPGDYICRKGEVGKEMYICTRGRLQVVDTDGKTVLATLKAGSYFGEISILNMGTAGNRRTASVRSVGYSDLFVLSKIDMWDVLKDYPAARVRLEAVAAKKIERYKKVPLEKAALPRSQSTPGLLESEGRVCLEDMWVSPNPLPNHFHGSPDGGSVDSRQRQRHLESPLSEMSVKTSTTMETERFKERMDSANSPRPSHYSPGKRNFCPGKKGSITSHESSDASLPPRETSANMAYGPQAMLHVTAPTPSLEQANCNFNPTNSLRLHSGRQLSQNNSTTDDVGGASPMFLSPSTIFNHNSTNSSLRDSGTSLHPGDTSTTSLQMPPNLYQRPGPGPACSNSIPARPLSANPPPQQKPEELVMEIKRLRDRLRTLESENLRMSTMINTRDRQVDLRLNEIELQLGCEDSSQEDSLFQEEEEKNQESFI